MKHKIKVWWCKRQAKKAYLRWINTNNDLDCGQHMASMVRPLAAQHAENQANIFDIYMDRLRDLGESVPNTRLGSKEPSHDSQ